MKPKENGTRDVHEKIDDDDLKQIYKLAMV